MADTKRSNPFKYLNQDFPSSIVVFLVALPLCLGIAFASDPSDEPNIFAGLITGIVGGIVAGALSKSPLAVSGPAAGLLVIVYGAIETLGWGGFLVAVVLCGVLQLALGYLRAGIIGYFFPSSVIKGMLSAIGLTLIGKQLPHAIGWDKDFEGDFSFFQPDGENTFTEIIRAVENLNQGALLISALSLAILILWERPFMKKIKALKLVPAPLLVVILGITLNHFMGSIKPEWQMVGAEHMVNLPIISNLSELSGVIRFPDFGALFSHQFVDIMVVAITLAVVASLETLLSIEATDKLDPYKRTSPPNAELKAQGVGNLVAGLLGGLPMTAVIVRSSANVASGGRTKMSAILHGIWLLLAVLFIPGLLNMIPLASLAAILLVVGYKLAKPQLFIQHYRYGWDQLIPFVITIVAILLTDLLIGIAIGLGVGLLFVLKTNFRASITITKEGEKYLLRFKKSVSFLNKALLSKALDKVPPGAEVLIDGSRADFIDHDIAETINEFRVKAADKGIKVKLKNTHSTSNSSLLDMMKEDLALTTYEKLLLENRAWAEEKSKDDPEYFQRLYDRHDPKILWIGSTDSLIPITEITNTEPGEIIVHRNLANLINQEDRNLLSVLQYAVEVLKVEHVVVCGHYDVRGIWAAYNNKELDMVNLWLHQLNQEDKGDAISQQASQQQPSDPSQMEEAVRAHVLRQVGNLARTKVMQQAWEKGSKVTLHGWTYDLRDGKLREVATMDSNAESPTELAKP